MSSKSNPWKTLSSRVVYQNNWIRVREDQVLRPDGLPGIYGVVDSTTALGVVAFKESGKVILVGQYRYTTDQYSWEIVEGGKEKGESPLQAIQRELAEEAGMAAENWVELGSDFHTSNCFTSEVCRLWAAYGLTEKELEPDPTEVLEVQVVSFGRAVEMAIQGEITDAMSVIALLYLDNLDRNGKIEDQKLVELIKRGREC